MLGLVRLAPRLFSLPVRTLHKAANRRPSNWLLAWIEQSKWNPRRPDGTIDFFKTQKVVVAFVFFNVATIALVQMAVGEEENAVFAEEGSVIIGSYKLFKRRMAADSTKGEDCEKK
jgi:hypothetical protein